MCHLVERSENGVEGCSSIICKRRVIADAAQRWPDNTVFKYRLVGILPGSDAATMDKAFAQAWDKWAKFCPTYKFQKATGSDANITISMLPPEKYTHGDSAGYAQIGPDGNLTAYVEFRGNAKTRWGFGAIHTLFLHEFGHVLGLSHSMNDGAIMAPVIQNMDSVRTLTLEDSTRIQNFISSKPPGRSYNSPNTPQRYNNAPQTPYRNNNPQNSRSRGPNQVQNPNGRGVYNGVFQRNLATDESSTEQKQPMRHWMRV
ncbi:Stromelysin-2 [Arthrobotrys entomopaga]|nr:Stromelysin-2 [Arthrobotrys entomopaga]